MRRPALALILPLALITAACGGSGGSSSSGSATSAPGPATSTAPAASSSTASTAPTTSTSTTATSATVKLSTRVITGVGTVIVNGEGRTLYAFLPDAARRVTCTGSCAAVWPPLAVAAGRRAETSGGVNASLVSSDPNPPGGRVVTYAGWPLYMYVADPQPGTDHGQGINSSGGLWYVIAPSGKLVKNGVHHHVTATTPVGPYNSGGAGY